MKYNIHKSISRNIKKYRLLNNMTQEELAGKLDLDTQYYAQLERGERNFTIEKIIRLCAVFHIGIENIIEMESITETETESPGREDTARLIQNLASKLEKLSPTQLSLVEKFIAEIIPYTK